MARWLPGLPAALVARGDSGIPGRPGGCRRCPAARLGRIWLAGTGVPLGCRRRPAARRGVRHRLAGRWGLWHGRAGRRGFRHGLAGCGRGHLRGGPDDRGWLLRPTRFGGRGRAPGRLGWAATPWLRLRHSRVRDPLRRSGCRVRCRRLSGAPRGGWRCVRWPGGPGRGRVRGGRRRPAQIRLAGGVPAVLPRRPVAVWRRSASARRRLFRLLAGVVRAFGRHACASSISFGRGRRCPARQPASPTVHPGRSAPYPVLLKGGFGSVGPLLRVVGRFRLRSIRNRPAASAGDDRTPPYRAAGDGEIPVSGRYGARWTCARRRTPKARPAEPDGPSMRRREKSWAGQYI